MNKKILVVDDEGDLVSALKDGLELQGYQVVTATDGISAVEAARREDPKLILLDLMLPKLDGFRVLKLLKADKRFQATPILVITGRSGLQDVTLALECGAEGYFSKPLQFDTIFNRVRVLAPLEVP